MSHILLLHIEDAVRDNRFLIVNDLSDYDPQIPISNRYFYVQAPGFEDAVEVLLTKEGRTYLSSIQLQTSDTLDTLPDGLYTATYSVAPNDQIKTVYYHFRTVALEARLAGRMLACLADGKLQLDSVGNFQAQKEERLLIRAEMIMSGLRNKRITDELEYNQLYTQYQEVERILNLIDEYHV